MLVVLVSLSIGLGAFSASGNLVLHHPDLADNTVILHVPRVFLIWWGPRWRDDRSNSKAGIELLFKEIPGSAYQSIVAQYGVFGNVVLGGSHVDAVAVPAHLSCADVWHEIVHARRTFGWTNTIDTLFLVFPQRGSTYLQTGHDSCLSFPSYACAVHTAFQLPGQVPDELRFAVIAYPADSQNCLGYSADGTATSAIESIVTHEFAGTETDKTEGEGWIDPTLTLGENEISDACRGRPVMGLPNVWTQRLWDNLSSSCVAAGTITNMSGFAVTPTSQGYWLATSTGRVVAFGDARFHGSMGNTRLNAPIVGLARTATSNGYWLAAADGGVFSFGDARFHGSMGNTHLNKPIVAIAATASGQGYWLAAADGGVFSFGDARFHGSMGNIHLNKPVVAIAATASGQGYWLAAADGGVFSFGDARFHGSMGNTHLNKPVVAIAATASGRGYWLAAADGGVFSLNAAFRGSPAQPGVARPVFAIVGIPNPQADPYALASTDMTVFSYGGHLLGQP